MLVFQYGSNAGVVASSLSGGGGESPIPIIAGEMLFAGFWIYDREVGRKHGRHHKDCLAQGSLQS